MSEVIEVRDMTDKEEEQFLTELDKVIGSGWILSEHAIPIEAIVEEQVSLKNLKVLMVCGLDRRFRKEYGEEEASIKVVDIGVTDLYRSFSFMLSLHDKEGSFPGYAMYETQNGTHAGTLTLQNESGRTVAVLYLRKGIEKISDLLEEYEAQCVLDRDSFVEKRTFERVISHTDKKEVADRMILVDMTAGDNKKE